MAFSVVLQIETGTDSVSTISRTQVRKFDSFDKAKHFADLLAHSLRAPACVMHNYDEGDITISDHTDEHVYVAKLGEGRYLSFNIRIFNGDHA